MIRKRIVTKQLILNINQLILFINDVLYHRWKEYEYNSDIAIH